MKLTKMKFTKNKKIKNDHEDDEIWQDCFIVNFTFPIK